MVSVSLEDEIQNEAETTSKVDLIRTRRQRDSAEKEVLRLTEQLEQSNRALFVVEQAAGTQLAPPTWLSPKKPKKSKKYK